MKILIKSLSLAFLFGSAWLTTSCQTTQPASTEVSSAITCDKCKTVWVKRAVPGGASGKGSYYALRSVKTMTCPDCESAIVNFLKTGQLKHSCSNCGGTMTHCTSH